MRLFKRADGERFALLAMHKILVERGLWLREYTDTGAMLIFPSYYRRERPELVVRATSPCPAATGRTEWEERWN
ncbi:MAG TPA: hypothetical protein VNT99_05320 [Methylomirabilota bacterium]|nr:hypothetical protein [Methylomirabilota bacterium]